jgi:hypothetical protein
MILVLAGLAFLAGAISLASRADERLVRGLKIASLLTLLAFVALTFTGLVPDVLFEKGAGFSGTFQNAFGTFHANVSDENLGALTGPLLFDIMEHVPLVLPGLAALLCFCIWQYGRRVVDDASVRASVLSILAVTFAWVLAVGGIGVYVSKVLTFPYIR